METFGDAYFAFAYGNVDECREAVDYLRTHDIPGRASLLLYAHLHDDDSEFPAFVVLARHVRARLEAEAEEGFAGVDPVLGHIGTILGRHASEGLFRAVVDERFDDPRVTDFVSDCIELFSDVPASYLSEALKRLSDQVLPLMSLMEHTLFALMVCCFCVIDQIPSATPADIEERINAFAAVLECGNNTPRFLSLIPCSLSVAMNTPFAKWFAHCRELCDLLRHFINDVLGLPQLAALLPQ